MNSETQQFSEQVFSESLSDQSYLQSIVEQMQEVAKRIKSGTATVNDAEFLFIASIDVERIVSRI
jgi:hypothetical protein